eukprot:jgi/Phyca11/536068/estExt2_fgenesh1_pg.C_PHYCAscaffold_470012
MPLPEAEAFVLNVVTSGSGTKERLLYPILLGRTNEELSMLKALTAENSTGSVDRNTVVAKTFSLQAVDQAVAAILANLLVQAFADGEPGEQWLVAGSCVAPRDQLAQATTQQQARLNFILRHYGVSILGTAGTWFLFDIVYYSQNHFSASILKVVGLSYPSLQQLTTEVAFVSLMTLPGYCVAVTS